MELRIRGCHPYRWPFQTILLTLQGSAGPRSLATTNGVSIDFLSSGYLDVSVPRVGPSCEVTGHYTRRVSPFGHPWITGSVLLPTAFRSLPRPSSPVCAKASPVCPYRAWPESIQEPAHQTRKPSARTPHDHPKAPCRISGLTIHVCLTCSYFFPNHPNCQKTLRISAVRTPGEPGVESFKLIDPPARFNPW
jgi:hypothetical protein